MTRAATALCSTGTGGSGTATEAAGEERPRRGDAPPAPGVAVARLRRRARAEEARLDLVPGALPMRCSSLSWAMKRKAAVMLLEGGEAGRAYKAGRGVGGGPRGSGLRVRQRRRGGGGGGGFGAASPLLADVARLSSSPSSPSSSSFCFRRSRRRPYATAPAAIASAVVTVSALVPAAAAAAAAAGAATAPCALAPENANMEAARFSKQGLVATSSASTGTAKPPPFWLPSSRASPATTAAAAAAAASDTTGDTGGGVLGALGAFSRSVWSGSKRALLEDLLKVFVWSFFVERLLQSALVGWGQSGRVGPVEQLGGTLMEPNPSDARFAETQAVLEGVRLGRYTVHLNTERASPDLFTKVDCTVIRHRPLRESEPRVKDQDTVELHRQQEAVEDAGEADGGDSLLFFEYAAPAFAHLRGVYGMPSPEYRRSFREGSRMIALASNSKSAQSFIFSEDGKYMLKTASEAELVSMLRLLPYYADHVSRRRGSLISRFYGVYRVTNPRTKRSTIFVSSSNVFSTEKRLDTRYDLKGSVVGRRTMKLPRKKNKNDDNNGGAAIKPTTMLKDLDLADGAKIRLAAGCKKRLMAELRADAEFLAGLGVMDYSLLVGIHRPNRPKPGKLLALPLWMLSVASRPAWAAGCFVLGFLPGGARRGGRRPQVGVYPGRETGVVYYVGIIDVLQRYNLKKILERGAKGVVFNRNELSAVPPEEYRDRFLAFIDGRTE